MTPDILRIMKDDVSEMSSRVGLDRLEKEIDLSQPVDAKFLGGALVCVLEKLRSGMSQSEHSRGHTKLYVSLIAIFALILSSCAPGAGSSTEEVIKEFINTSTIEVMEITEEVSKTPTKTATPEPTETRTPTETATPEMKEPAADFDWEEFIESMPISAESKDLLKEDVENQFDGGLQESDGAYVLRGITRGEMVIYDSGQGLPSDQSLVLPTGHEIPATFKCAFVIKTASGELVKTEVQVAPYVYHPDELTGHLLGGMPKTYEDSSMIEAWKIGLAQKWPGAMSLLEENNLGLANPPQVLGLYFAIPEGTEFGVWSDQGYLTEAMQIMYVQEQLDEFAQTGVWPFVFETQTGELINLVLPVDFYSLKHMYPEVY